MATTQPLLELTGVRKCYGVGDGLTPVLEGVDLAVSAGECIAVVGPSGCGKSTLLNLIGTLDRPTAGSIRFEGRDVADLKANDAARFRNESIGFVFQRHHLLPQCTALENALVPTLVAADREGARDRAVALLEHVGLGERLDRRPAQLSGGECQRVAVVRALMNRPHLLLADEPTGSLNEEGAGALVELLLDLNAGQNMAMVVVTHSEKVAESMGRVFTLHDGALVVRG